ncbi:hypothetical protein [Aquipseudomonas alcaligenes]|uniref:hypothetical protein n=1 Tax=Aquipseudomonas alcaligenes TaxID=43263 RepID=UPI00223BE671|nr:hypothetical protein [Pseudomonas alcaligenes]
MADLLLHALPTFALRLLVEQLLQCRAGGLFDLLAGRLGGQHGIAEQEQEEGGSSLSACPRGAPGKRKRRSFPVFVILEIYQ